MSNRPGSVMFVCSLNQIRSPMAEFLTRDIYSGKIFSQSAGVEAGGEDGFMQAAMLERGIDTSSHEPITIEEIDDIYVDLIVTLTERAHEHTLKFVADQSAAVEFWPIENPSRTMGRRDEILEAYRKTREVLEARIRERFGD